MTIPRDVTTTDPAATGTDLPADTVSFAFAIGPLAYALHEYAANLKEDGDIANLTFGPITLAQDRLVYRLIRDLWQIPYLHNLKSMVSSDYEALNEFLVAQGFDPLFQPFPSTDLGTMSIIDATMRWKVSGTATTFERQGVEYPAFNLTNETAEVQNLCRVGLFPDRVLLRSPSAQHKIYLAMLPEDYPPPSNGAELLWVAEQMFTVESTPANITAGVILPQINFNMVNALPWLNGLWVTTPGSGGKSYQLNQCYQYVTFSMNEMGARTAAAFAGMVSGGMEASQQPYVVDRPFVVAVIDGITITAVFYLCPDSWSEPQVIAAE